MGYRMLEHVTDALIEVEEESLSGAFETAGMAVAAITLDPSTVSTRESRRITVSGTTLECLLFSWLEEVIFVLITEGFAIGKIKATVSTGGGYRIEAAVLGEEMDLARHKFRVEAKAPTFHEMDIRTNGRTSMRFLLDL